LRQNANQMMTRFSRKTEDSLGPEDFPELNFKEKNHVGSSPKRRGGWGRGEKFERGLGGASKHLRSKASERHSETRKSWGERGKR